MVSLKEHEPLGSKTTMRIGGTARWYAELTSREDVEQAVHFVQEKDIPLIPLGGGSNMIFDDGEIGALVVRLKADTVTIDSDRVTVQAGKNLPMLINELAKKGLDLSPLTGILGTVGGALFGNAGQGPQGIWIDTFVETVTVYLDGTWQTLPHEECRFRYRESRFKDIEKEAAGGGQIPPIIWQTTLCVPSGDPAVIHAEIERLLKRRIETQPHIKTAGSCFKALGTEPAWQLIERAGLRGKRFGGIEISQKHANFLLNMEKATFADAKSAVEEVQKTIPDPLEVEMRFVQSDGKLAF